MNINNKCLENITLKEKIGLIFNTNLWNKSILNESKINKINFLEDYTMIKKEAKVLTSLADSWNLDLVKKYVDIRASKLAVDHNSVVIPFGLINYENRKIYGVDRISDDLQYIQLLLTTYVTALQEKDIVVIGLYDDEVDSKLDESVLHLLTNIELDGIIFANNVPSVHDINFEQLIFEKSSNENHSYTLLNHITSIDKEDIEKSLHLYEDYEKKLASETITLEEFNELVNDEIIFNMDDIEKLVSKIKCFIDKVYNKQKLNNTSNNNPKNAMKSDQFYRLLAHESSVFFKKEEGVLEHLTKRSVAFMGHFLSNHSIFKDQETWEESINKYFPGCIGFFDVNNNIDFGVKNPEVVIIKMSTLEIDQLGIIKAIYNKGINIILIVPSELRLLQNDLYTYCSVIIKADLHNVSSFYGVLDILSLKVNSRGHLSKAISVEKGISKSDGPFVDHSFYRLNNSHFKYKQLKSMLPKIEFTVTNLDSKKNFDVIQIYIYNELNGSTNKVLIDFKKISLEAKETQLISIDIDLNCFDFYTIDLNSKLVVELNSFNTDLKLTTHNKSTKKTLKRRSRKLVILMALLLYFNVPLIYSLRSVFNADYRMFMIIIILIINYLIIKVVFRKKKRKKQKKKTKELLTVVDKIDYLEESKDIMIDNDRDLSKENIIVDQKVESITNQTDEVILPEEVFNDQLDMGKYCNMLCSFMEAKGLKAEVRLFKELFSSLIASRLLITSSKDYKITIEFLKQVSSFMGSSLFIEKLQTGVDTYEMLLENEKSDLMKCLNSAQKHSDKIHFMVFKDIELVKADHNFSELIKYVEDPYQSVNENRINISENIWFIFVPKKSKESSENISEKILFSSFNIDVGVELVEPKDSINQTFLPLSYNYLMDHFKNSKELFFLNEEIWKKIDELEIYLNKNFDFKFDNQYIRQLERYQSMYLMSSGQAYEAIDSLLSQNILPIILNKTAVKIDENEDSLLVLCDRLFGLDNMTKSRHLLSKINENMIGQEK